MRVRVALFGLLALAASGCTSYESAYERGVYDYEPIYCYRSLADIACSRTPNVRDERQLVNYYGPAPSKYDRPDPPPEAELQPPPELDTAAGGEGEPGSAGEDEGPAIDERPPFDDEEPLIEPEGEEDAGDEGEHEEEGDEELLST